MRVVWVWATISRATALPEVYIQLNVWLFFFSLQGRNYICCSRRSVPTIQRAALRMKWERGKNQAYVSNKRCHEQNRHTLVPSRVLICTICGNFNLGLGVNSKWREKHEKTSSFRGFRRGKARHVGQMLNADWLPGITLLLHFPPVTDRVRKRRLRSQIVFWSVGDPSWFGHVCPSPHTLSRALPRLDWQNY